VSTLRSKAAPLSSSSRSLPSWVHLRFAGHEMLGGCGERGGEVGAGGWSGRISLGGWRRRLALIGILAVLGKMQIESTVFFPTVVAGLNNQWGGEKLLF
jgi:hypothetical protein